MSRPEARWPLHIQFFLWATSVSLFTCFQPQLKQKPNVRVRERRDPGLREAELTDGLHVSLASHPPCHILQPSQARSAPYAQRLFSAHSLSRVDSATPLTVACQAPLSMDFSRQEYWRELPFPAPKELSAPWYRLKYLRALSNVLRGY